MTAYNRQQYFNLGNQTTTQKTLCTVNNTATEHEALSIQNAKLITTCHVEILAVKI